MRSSEVDMGSSIYSQHLVIEKGHISPYTYNRPFVPSYDVIAPRTADTSSLS